MTTIITRLDKCMLKVRTNKYTEDDSEMFHDTCTSQFYKIETESKSQGEKET